MVILPTHIEQAFSYPAYMQFAQERFAEGCTTSDADELNTPEMLNYTAMNFQRIKRITATTTLRDDLVQALQAIPKKQIWLVLSESWCGDASQTLPVLNKMAEATPMIELKILLRDKHPDVMDAYLTGTSRSIPKLICLDAATLHEYGQWGPRPKPAQDIVLRMKAEGKDHDEMITLVHAWYGKDRTKTLQEEMLALVRAWSSAE